MTEEAADKSNVVAVDFPNPSAKQRAKLEVIRAKVRRAGR
jgi:hypothetical protein